MVGLDNNSSRRVHLMEIGSILGSRRDEKASPAGAGKRRITSIGGIGNPTTDDPLI